MYIRKNFVSLSARKVLNPEGIKQGYTVKIIVADFKTGLREECNVRQSIGISFREME